MRSWSGSIVATRLVPIIAIPVRGLKPTATFERRYAANPRIREVFSVRAARAGICENADSGDDHLCEQKNSEVTPAKPELFLNRRGRFQNHSCSLVAFDEFAGKNKRTDKALVDIMKNYMANKSFSRGIETLGAEASMVFVGNTQHNVAYMLKHADLFDDLPEKFYDSAFLDRIHFYIPGWEVDIIRGEMFSDGYGFVVDYLAEILRSMRNYDFSDRYRAQATLSADISTRDQDGINKTFSGLMKILFPQGEASKQEIDELLAFSMEGRKRVKDQLMRIDSTYPAVRFVYENESGKVRRVSTLEEEEYPAYYYKTGTPPEDEPGEKSSGDSRNDDAEPTGGPEDSSQAEPREEHLTFKENQRGITFDSLLGPYVRGASRITVTDPYIRLFYQVRNFMELLETVAKLKPREEEVAVHLVTIEDEFKGDQQKQYLFKMQESSGAAGICLTWEFTEPGTTHARHIVTDTGWKILLDRGLDIFQHYEMNDAFTFANRLQQYRPCKAFEVTFLRTENSGGRDSAQEP